MSSKYQIKTPNGNSFLPTKNDFINHCQSFYNDSLKSKKPLETHFSFDGGENWYDIKDFKALRQTIQNEKQINPNQVPKGKKSKSSWLTIILWLLVIYGTMAVIDSNVTNISIYDSINTKLNGLFKTDTNTNKIDKTETQEPEIVSDDNSNSIETAPIEKSEIVNQNENNTIESNSVPESNSNYQNTPPTPSQRICSYCKGTGKCRTCSVVFRTHYWGGNGWKSGNETRPGQTMCNNCKGAGVKYGLKHLGQGDPETEKCYNSSCKGGWEYCRECNNYGNGTLLGLCRECKGTGFKR